jgi:molybdate transport system ATP-binding protein
MQQHEHWDIINQVDKKPLSTLFLQENHFGELSIFNTQNGILFSDIAIDNFIKKIPV